MNLYISGINDKCGKTVVISGITAVLQSLGYNTGIYKPIATGAINENEGLFPADFFFVKFIDPYISVYSSYIFKEDAIPAYCCEKENIKISLTKINEDYGSLSKKSDILLVESPGGLMTPLFDKVFAGVIPEISGIPVVFVVMPGRDSINNILNELNTARMSDLSVKGVIINKMSANASPDEKNFPKLIEKYTDLKLYGILGEIPQPVSAVPLITETLNGINIKELLDMQIPKLSC